VEVISGVSHSVWGIVGLTDGRVVIAARGPGRDRLVAYAPGKVPTALIATNEETSAPMAAVGRERIAFTIGRAPHAALAVASTATGRITTRIAPGKGEITSVACSPDEKTLYFAAAGKIWSVPLGGGEARFLRAGEAVSTDPDGRSLVISTSESSQVKLFRYFLDGSAEREIVTDGSVPLAGGVARSSTLSEGRLLVSLAPKDSWFNVPGIVDTKTGKITRLPSPPITNSDVQNWTPDRRIVELREGLRAAIWKFAKR
jgi:hypothetical protein